MRVSYDKLWVMKNNKMKKANWLLQLRSATMR